MKKEHNNPIKNNPAPSLEQEVQKKGGESNESEFDDLVVLFCQTLTNAKSELANISDLVEGSMIDLSGEFQRLVENSAQQSDVISQAHALVEQVHESGADTSLEHITDALKDSARLSGNININVNNMILSMQFQDRAKQLMQAVSLSLDVLIKVSEKSGKYEQDQKSRTNILKLADKEGWLSDILEGLEHKGLDKRFITRLFEQNPDEETTSPSHKGKDDTEIEMFE